MYEALHQRTIKLEIITGENFYIWYQRKKNNYNSVQCRLSGKICFSCIGTIRSIASLQ
jgi:hypothetical protein